MPVFPNINGQVKTVLRWYTDERLTNDNKKECQQEFGCDFVLWAHPNRLIPFQIWRPTSQAEIVSWKIYRATSGAFLYDLVADIDKLVITPFVDVDYIVYDGSNLSQLIPDGFYFSRIEDEDGVVYRSEQFRVMCDTVNPESVVLNYGFAGWDNWEVQDNDDVTFADGQELTAGDPDPDDPFNGMVIMNFGDDLAYTYFNGFWTSATPDHGTLWFLNGNWYQYSTGVGWQGLFSPPVDVGPPSMCWSGTSDVVVQQTGVFPTDGTINDYELYVEVTGHAGGTLTIQIGGGSSFIIAGNGAFYFYGQNNGTNDTITLTPSNNFEACVDSVGTWLIQGDECHMMLEWTNCGNIGTTFYEFGFTNRMYLDRKALISEPTPRIFIEGEEDGMKNFRETFRRKEVEYKLAIGYVPWFLLDALSEIPLHDTVRLTLPFGQGSELLKRVRIEPAWDEVGGTCYAQCIIFFQLDEAAVATACCTMFDPPCPRPCQEVHGTTDDPNPGTGGGAPTSGLWYVLANTNSITLAGHDVLGLPIECESNLVTGASGYPDSYFDVVSSTWKPVAVLEITFPAEDDPSDDICANIKFSAIIMPRYRARLQWSADGITWENTIYDYSAAQWAVGTGFVDAPIGWGYLRLEVYFGTCLIGRSLVEAFSCCKEAQTECSYYQDLRFDGGEDQAGYTVGSFLVDGIEQLDDPINFPTPLSVITIGGLPFVTNLIDALNSAAVACFSFWPTGNLRAAAECETAPGGGFFRIRYPQSVSTFEIVITHLGLDVYRYTESAAEMWNGSAWVQIPWFYSTCDEADQFTGPEDCEDLA